MLLVHWLASLRHTILSAPAVQQRRPHEETGQSVQVELLEQRRMLAAPVAVMEYSEFEGEWGTNLHLDGGPSYDPDYPGDPSATISAWSWDLDGAGSEPNLTGSFLELTWQQLSETYGWTAVGDYEVTLTVTSQGEQGSTTETFSIGGIDPVATFSATVGTQTIYPMDADGVVTWGQDVTLDASGSYDPDENNQSIVSYDWDLDDDNVADVSGETVTLGWEELSGEYGWNEIDDLHTISLIVTDDEGDPSSATVGYITLAGHAPVAIIDAPQTISENEGLTLVGSGSYDQDEGGESIQSYVWSIDELNLSASGYATDAANITLSANDIWQNLHSTWTKGGEYEVTLTVYDDDNGYGIGSDTTTVTIQVAGEPPTASISDPGPLAWGAALQLDGSGSHDNDETSQAIETYAWDLNNDGVYGEVVGSDPLIDFATLSDQFGWTEVGTYTVGLHVTDDEGETATTSRVITLTGLAPSAVITGPDAITSGGTATLTGSQSHDNDEGESAISAWEWDLDGDGNYGETGETGETIEFSPAGASGEHTVWLRVTDNDDEGASSTASVSHVVTVGHLLSLDATDTRATELVTGIPEYRDDASLTLERSGVGVDVTATISLTPTTEFDGVEDADYEVIVAGTTYANVTDFTVTLTGSATSEDILVRAKQDAEHEPIEGLSLTLVGFTGAGYAIDTAVAEEVVEIADDDVAVVGESEVNPPTDGQCSCECSCGTATETDDDSGDTQNNVNAALDVDGSVLPATSPVIHSGGADGTVVTTIDITLPSGQVPDRLVIDLDFGGTTQSKTFFKTSEWVAGAVLRLKLETDVSNATSFPEGRYAATVDVTPGFSDGSSGYVDGSVATHTSGHTLTRLDNSDFGKGVSLSGVHQLMEHASGDVSLVRDDGSVAFFEKNGSSYDSPRGAYGALTKDGTGFSLTAAGGTVTRFKLDGRIKSVTDARGVVTTTYDYDDENGGTGSGQLETITDEFGTVTTLAYDGTTQLLTSISDNRGRSLTYTHNGSGRLTQVTGPAATSGGTAISATFAYDGSDLLTSYTRGGGDAVSFAYDSDGRLTSLTEHGMATTVDSADARGIGVLVLRSNSYATSAHGGETTSYVYDLHGQLLEQTDPSGRQTYRTERDEHGRVTFATSAGNISHFYEHDDHGRRTLAIHAPLSGETWSETWSYSTDPAERQPTEHVTFRDDGTSETLKYTYDDGQLSTAITADPDGDGPLGDATTRYVYDLDGMLIQMIEPDPETGDPSGAETSYTYDAFGRMTTMTDANGAVWTWGYNDLGQRTEAVTPDPDGNGVLQAATTKYKYDGFGRLTETTEPDPASGLAQGAVTLYEYDLSGNMTQVVDAVGGTTTYEYDDHDRVTRTVDAEGGVTLAEYDPQTGRLIRSGGAEGEWVLYEYDAAGRVTQTTNPSSDHLAHFFDQDEDHSIAGGVLLEDAYFANGEVWHITTGDPEVVSGRLVFEGGARSDAAYVEGGNSDGHFSANVRFHSGGDYEDGVGQPAGSAKEMAVLALRHQSGTEWLRLYLNRTDGTVTLSERAGSSTTSQIASDTHAFAQDTDYEIKVTLDGASVVVWIDGTQVFDETANHTSGSKYGLLRQGQGLGDGSFAISIDNLLFAPEGGGIAVTTTEYDDDGRVTKVISPDHDGLGTAAALTTTYAYDDDGNLASTTEAATGITARTTTYDYDADGNLTRTTLPDPSATAGDEVTLLYGYDLLGRQTSSTDPLGNVTFTRYDHAGRVISENRPSPAGDGRVEMTYEYDDAGNMTRAIQADLDGNGTDSPPQTVYEYDLLGRQTASTDPLGNTTRTRYDHAGRVIEVLGADLDGQGSQEPPTTRYEYDVAGRMIVMTDAEGHATTYGYDLLGRVVSTTDAAGYVTHTDYDDSGRVVRVIGEAGSWTETAYDVAGNVTSTRRGQGEHHAAFFEVDVATLSTADTLHTGQNWHVVTGDPELTGGELVLSVNNSGNSIVLLNGGSPDGTLSLDITFDESSNYDGSRIAMIYFRHQDGNDWHRLYLYENTDYLKVLEQDEYEDPENAGQYLTTTTQLTDADFTFEQGQTYRVDVALDGTSMVVSIDGREILDTNAGKVFGSIYGVRAQNSGGSTGSQTVRIDNMVFDRDAAAIATTSYDYDAVGRLAQVTDAEGNTTGYQYDLFGQTTQVTDAEGNTITREYDDLGRLTTESSGGRSQTWAYDQNGRVTQSIDVFGRTTSTTYDDSGAVSETTVSYNDGTDSLTLEPTAYFYDELGRVTRIELPDPNTSTADDEVSVFYEYDLAGNLTRMATGDATTTLTDTAYAYDDLNRRTQTIEGVGSTEAATSSVKYDLLGRVTESIDATSNTSTYVYDERGLLVSLTDGGSNVTTHSYDELGRRTATTAAINTTDNAITQYGYDFAGNLTSLIDPATTANPTGNTTTWSYDLLGRKTGETITLDSTDYRRTYEYDGVGHLTRQTHRATAAETLITAIDYSFEFTYDGGSNYRLTDEEWLDINTDTEVTSTVGGYDWAYYDNSTFNEGRLQRASGQSTTIEYDYDVLGRVTSIVQQSGDDALNPTADVSITQEWDGLDRRTSVETHIHNGTSYVDDATTEYAYDLAGRVTSITQTDTSGSGVSVDPKFVEFAYDLLGRTTQIDRYESSSNASGFIAQSRFTYDDVGRLVSLTHDKDQSSGTTDNFADYDWTWNSAGRLAQFVSTDGTADYTYDDSGQLTEVDHTNNLWDQTYDWDEAGNTTSLDDGTTSVTTGDHNRITDDGTYTYQYDAEGNRTRKTDKSTGDFTHYAWDHRNRLIAVEEYLSGEDPADVNDAPQSGVYFTYDALNRKVGRQEDTNGDGTPENVEWLIHDAAGKRDGVTSVPLDDIIVALDDTGSVTTRYLHGPGIDQVLAEENYTDSEVYWTLADHQGSIRDVIHDDGSTIQIDHVVYDAFGNVISGTLTTRYGFTGREWDATIQLQNNLNRWWDAYLRKWASDDPIGFAAGDANLSRYVGNAATWVSDPSGLQDSGDGALLGGQSGLFGTEAASPPQLGGLMGVAPNTAILGRDNFGEWLSARVYPDALAIREYSRGGDDEERTYETARIWVAVTLNQTGQCEADVFFHFYFEARGINSPLPGFSYGIHTDVESTRWTTRDLNPEMHEFGIPIQTLGWRGRFGGKAKVGTVDLNGDDRTFVAKIATFGPEGGANFVKQEWTIDVTTTCDGGASATITPKIFPSSDTRFYRNLRDITAGQTPFPPHGQHLNDE